MNIQKRIAGKVLNASPKRIRFDNQRLADIKEAITKTDIRRLIREGAISENQEKGISRGRARKLKVQKSKGQRKGKGSKQGKHTARQPKKETWMNKIRSQRTLLQELKSKGLISRETFRLVYLKAKGGYFRSQRHMKIYLEDQNLFIKKDSQQTKQNTAEDKKETTKKTVKKTVKKTAKKTAKKEE